MKNQIHLEWDTNTEFSVQPHKSSSGLHRFSAACVRAFQSLKEKISSELAARFAGVRPEVFRLAVNEAAAVAASTSFPALFLPALAEEKVLLASRWEAKQQEIQQQSWLRAA